MRLEVEGQLALVIPVPVERRLFVLVVPDRDQGPRLAVLQHAAGACALELTRVEAGFERDRRSGAALLAEALHGRLEANVLDSSLSERGLQPPFVCTAINADHHLLDSLARRWAVTEVPHLLGGIEPTYTGIIEADDGLIDRLAEVASADGYRIGVSDPFSGASGLIDATRQARWALETIHQGDAGLARYGNDSDMFLPRTLSEARLAAERVLEPVLEYDREHGTELIRTLQTYLECDRSPKQAAQQLFIHNQTVNYRISRVEELTGRTMRSTSDISELWFGLRALALSASDDNA
jgi:purine catabolism regulator